jgi:hypothetical protein
MKGLYRLEEARISSVSVTMMSMRRSCASMGTLATSWTDDAPIVRLHGNAGDLLDRERHADGEHRMLGFDCGNGLVEVAFSVADAPAPPVEGSERDKHGLRGHLGGIRARLAHAEAALDELVAGLPNTENHGRLCDHGQAQRLPALV